MMRLSSPETDLSVVDDVQDAGKALVESGAVVVPFKGFEQLSYYMLPSSAEFAKFLRKQLVEREKWQFREGDGLLKHSSLNPYDTSSAFSYRPSLHGLLEENAVDFEVETDWLLHCRRAHELCSDFVDELFREVNAGLKTSDATEEFVPDASRHRLVFRQYAMRSKLPQVMAKPHKTDGFLNLYLADDATAFQFCGPEGENPQSYEPAKLSFKPTYPKVLAYLGTDAERNTKLSAPYHQAILPPAHPNHAGGFWSVSFIAAAFDPSR